MAITLLFWSSAFAGVRVALKNTDNVGGLSPGPLALLRFLVAGVCAVIYLVAAKKGLPRKEDLLKIFLSGLIGFGIYHPLFNFAEQTVASGAAAVVIASSPIFTATLSTLFLKERLNFMTILGIAFSFAGVVVISLGGQVATGSIAVGALYLDPRVLLLVVCALATATYMVISKSLLHHYEGLQLTSYTILAGILPLLIFAPTLGRELPHVSSSTYIAVLYLGIAPAFLSYGFWNKALAYVPATQLSVFLNFQPLVASAIAWVWLKEIPTSLTWIGGVIAIIGVSIVQRSGKIPIPEELT